MYKHTHNKRYTVNVTYSYLLCVCYMGTHILFYIFGTCILFDYFYSYSYFSFLVLNLRFKGLNLIFCWFHLGIHCTTCDKVFQIYLLLLSINARRRKAFLNFLLIIYLDSLLFGIHCTTCDKKFQIYLFMLNFSLIVN